MGPLRRRPVRNYLVLWLFLLSAVAFLDRTNISIAGPAIQRELGLDNVHLGWVFSAFLVGYAAFQVVGGWLAVRFGPRRVLAAGVLWWGAFTALTTMASPAVAHALAALIAIRFALGAGEAVVYPASNQFVAQWIPVSERGRANGWIFAGVGASGLCIPALNWLVSGYGWRTSFWLCAAAGIAVGAGWYRLARDVPEQHPRVGPTELELIQATRTAPALRGTGGAPGWRAALINRNVAALSLSYFTFGYVAWIFFSWFFIYLAQARGLNLKASALYSVLPFIGMTICCIGGGVISDRIARRFGFRLGRCGVAVFSLSLTAVFLVVGSHAESARAASLFLAGGAGALYLSQSSFWAVSADIAGQRSGVVSGVMNMACQIGGAITASLTPWLAARFGWKAAFLFAAALAVVGAASWLLVDPARTGSGRGESSAGKSSPWSSAEGARVTGSLRV
jgi:ACS family glucarate transporter-like MFS transporter